LAAAAWNFKKWLNLAVPFWLQLLRRLAATQFAPSLSALYSSQCCGP
jgi:hypothetical protein